MKNTINQLVNNIKDLKISDTEFRKEKSLSDIIEWLDQQWLNKEDTTWQEEGYIIEMTYLSNCIEIQMKLTDDATYEDTLIGIVFWDEISHEEIEALYKLSI